MGKFEAGDYVKVEFRDETSGESEWMWVQVQDSDDSQRILFGKLGNGPVTNTNLRLGMEIAVSTARTVCGSGHLTFAIRQSARTEEFAKMTGVEVGAAEESVMLRACVF